MIGPFVLVEADFCGVGIVGVGLSLFLVSPILEAAKKSLSLSFLGLL